ncbi:MAG: GGDEF domain-containing protein [Spirochaetales bacterium]|nr:GGDEF domain-containing protein [Spirochaetales bacterium]
MIEISKKKEFGIYLVTAFLCVLVIFLVNKVALQIPSTAVKLDNKWNVSFDDLALGTEEIPFYYTDKTENFSKGLYRLEYNLKLNKAFINPDEKYFLVFPASSGNGIRAKINGFFVGSFGDLLQGNAAIWNFSSIFNVSGEILSESTKVSVDLYCLYEVGLSVVPYLVPARGSVLFKIGLLLWAKPLMHFLIGGMFVLGIIFILTGSTKKMHDYQKIFLGFGLLFISGFFLDYSFMNNLVFKYLYFKKIILSCHFIGIGFFVLYASEFLKDKKRNIRIIVCSIVFLLVSMCIIWPGDMSHFRKFYKHAFFTDFFLLFYIMYLYVRTEKHSLDFTIIIAGGCATIVFSFHDLLSLFTAKAQVFTSQYGITILFLAGSSVIIQQIIGNYIESVRQSIRADLFYTESMQDPLTGCYNRKILPLLEPDLSADYSMLVFDMDDFKIVNDTYGHPAGDRTLIKLTDIINGSIRGGDYLVRLGGDEFAAILPDCGLDAAIHLGREIQMTISNLKIPSENGSFKFSASLGVATALPGEDFQDVLSKADKQMYLNKHLKKSDDSAFEA